MKALLFALVFLLSCAKQNSITLTGAEMGMPYKIILRERVSTQTVAKVKKIIEETFKEVDQKLNHWNSFSEISLFNKSKSTEKIKVSPFLHNAIKIADTVHSLSEGRYDPSIGKVIHLWKMALRIEKVLSQEEVDSCKISSNWEKVMIHEDSIQKTHPELEIDLDGITKGYFCDVIVEKLKEIGLKNFLVEWSGEIKVFGGPFKILAGNDIILLKDKAIATSGPTFQIYKIDNTLYSHFIDPKTLFCKQIEDIYLSKSIIHDSCAIADGLATASILN